MTDLHPYIEKIRAFNRYYTNVIGILESHILESPYSLTEARILFEIHVDPEITARGIMERLRIDEGYLSRTLNKLKRLGLVSRQQSSDDGRAYLLKLTEKGRREFDKLNRSSEQEIGKMIANLDQAQLAGLMLTIDQFRHTLDHTWRKEISIEDIRIRTDLRAGDLSSVIYLHGRIYGLEYGYIPDFEIYVAESVREFYQKHDPSRERVWVCEHLNRMVGFLLLMNRGEAAQLRFFVILPEYRGIGLGKKLMDLFMDFLRACGYRSAYLLTVDELPAAAALYTRHGFRLVEEKPSTAFGKPLYEHRYELEL